MSNSNTESESEHSTQERFKRGAADAGRFFAYIADFIGFTATDAANIRETRFIIEKYIPTIVGEFYAQLLKFPATRKHFQKPDGTIDQDYLEMRMHHQAGFWRRAASGEYDEDFTRFVDYVGRAHTSNGADKSIFIPEQYVIGMVGFVQRGIADALVSELRDVDPDLERRASRSWNSFMMVILEMLTRAYGHNDAQGHDIAPLPERAKINDDLVRQLAVDTYERGLGMARSIEYKVVSVGSVEDIPDGQRKIVEVDGVSIGVFHHNGKWIVLHNSCLHRGGPVCAGTLEGDTLTCPWHGYQYDVTSGQLLLDRSARLESYKVDVLDGQVTVTIPILVRDEPVIELNGASETQSAAVESLPPDLKENEFLLSDLKAGQAKQLVSNGQRITVYNVAGAYYATQDECTHAKGPLSQGRLDGTTIVCPWHDSCFDVTNGEVLCPPARKPIQTFRVVAQGNVGRVDVPTK